MVKDNMSLFALVLNIIATILLIFAGISAIIMGRYFLGTINLLFVPITTYVATLHYKCLTSKGLL